MAITYRETSVGISYIKRYDKGNDAYSSIGGAGVDFDIIPTDAEVGDAILFQGMYDSGGQYYKLEFDVSSNVIADTIEGVWEYYSASSDTRDNSDSSWKPLQNVVDDGDFFQTNTDGKITVSWDMPDDWDNFCNPNGQCAWYNWDIRFRITNISNVTQTGKITNTVRWTNVIDVNVGSNTSVTFEDIYQANVSNGWGVVTKTGKSNYTFDCSLYVHNSVFYSSEEIITFINNRSINIQCTSHWGELTSTGQPYKCCTIRMEGANSDYSGTVLGKDGSTYYGLRIQFPQTDRSTRHNGFWGGGLGQYKNQKIKGGDFYEFRNYSFSDPSNIVSGLTYSDAHTEPAGATLFDMKCVNSPFAVRGRSYHTWDYFHRCDFTDVRMATSNPFGTFGVQWEESFVDCKINEAVPLAMFYSSSYGGEEYRDRNIGYRKYSLQSFILDNTSTNISDVNVSVFDNAENLVNSLKSNADGGIGANSGVTTNSGTDTLEYSGYDGSDKRFREVLMTNGASKNSRSIIHEATDSSFTLAEPFSTAFAEGDNFIEIPYVVYQSQRPDQTSGTYGWNYEPIKTHGPFRVSYRKYGYVSSDDSMSFSAPVVSDKHMLINTFVTKSEDDAGNITGISIDGVAKTVTITEVNTVNDVYDYCQWWHTRTDNLIYDEPITTIEGVNYTLAGGWELILQAKITGQFNISGTVKLTTALDLDDININGSLHVLLDSDSTLNFNNVSATVYNDAAYTLTINIDSRSNIIADAPGTGDGETNAIRSATLTITGLKSGSDVVILRAGTDTVLASVDQVQGTTFDYTYSTIESVDIGVIKQGFVPLYQYGYSLGSTNASLPVNQRVDRSYQ